MDREVYLYDATSDSLGYPILPVQDSISCHPAIGASITPASDVGSTFPHQGQSSCFLDESRMNSWSLHAPLYVYIPQMQQPIITWSTGEGTLTPPHQTLDLYDEGYSTIHSVDLLCQEMLPGFNLTSSASSSASPASLHSNSQEPDGYGIVANDQIPTYADHANVDTTASWREEVKASNAPPDKGHQYKPSSDHSPSQPSDTSYFYDFYEAVPQPQVRPTCIDSTISDFSSSPPSPPPPLPTLPDVLRTCPTEGYQGHCLVTSSDHPHPSPQVNNELATASLTENPATSDQPAGVREVFRGGRFLCSICGQVFAQAQGLNRHRRERHEPKLCPYCRAFKWGRPYLFKKHLETMHADVKSESAMDAATKARGGTIINHGLGRRGRKKQITLPNSGHHHRQGCSIITQHPLILFPPTAEPRPSVMSPPFDSRVKMTGSKRKKVKAKTS
ncbi:hypothetical protein B0F90DRAFT_1667231 [Multifurca ochricompacta]|uniref:C2H2-type domain-containing protein n=1 Tax=Multifurca ochricompacta TaxID=376703 RepID=A0AAD4M813_9AGAM|nr:hypothetical protein B0F90DRAFT_1667231 [Multifurca ochricompacta]